MCFLFIFPYFRWPVRSTWHYFNEIIRTWCSWRQWFRRQRTNSTLVRIFHFTQRSCGWSQTQFNVWHKTVLPAFIRSPSMYCLCGYWHYDLSKTTRKFKKKILLEIINNLLPAHWMFSRKTRNRIPNFSWIILTDFFHLLLFFSSKTIRLIIDFVKNSGFVVSELVAGSREQDKFYYVPITFCDPKMWQNWTLATKCSF